MAISNPVERQYPLVARVYFAFADFSTTTTGVGIPAITLPVNSIVTKGDLVILNAFDGTTPTLDVGDASSAARYEGANDATAAVVTPLTITRFLTTGSEPSVELELTWTDTTTGDGYLEVEYVITGRGNEAQP